MSLHHPLTTTVSCEPRQEFSMDKRDALVKRLQDLVFHISKDTSRSLDDNIIPSIHSEVDRIEVLIKDGEKHQDLDVEDRELLKESQPHLDPTDNALWSTHAPIEQDSMRISNTSACPPNPALQKSQDMTTSRATEISNVAEELASQLAASLKELQTRREESEHIHGLLLARVEMAAERVIYLESEISEMEDDFEANQSELQFLRIQLQAIEAQCAQHMPREEDEELSQSILNWKVDWEDIDRRSKARRMKRDALLANVHASRSAV